MSTQWMLVNPIASYNYCSHRFDVVCLFPYWKQIVGPSGRTSTFKLESTAYSQHSHIRRLHLVFFYGSVFFSYKTKNFHMFIDLHLSNSILWISSLDQWISDLCTSVGYICLCKNIR